MHNLSAQSKCQCLAVIRVSDNRVKIVHSLSRYVVPLGLEESDANHNMFFGFKGDRTKRSKPPAVKFKTALLSQVRGKKADMDTIDKHFCAINATTIMPISDSETDMAVCRAILLPLK